MAHGKVQKQGNCTLWIETERRWKAIFHLRTADSKTTEKGFLHRIVTGDEKWIFYDNPKRKKYYAKLGQSLPSTSTSTPRPNIHSSKIMLCIWWDQKDLVYYELKPGDSITGDRLQLTRLSRALWEKRPEYEQRHDKVILLNDNARPRVTKVVKKYLETLKWDDLPHPPYSPDIAPFNYWLFRRMQQIVGRFTSFAEIENWRKLDRLQRRVIFSRWNLKIAWKMGQSSRQWWTIINWSVHSFCFEINAQKNGPN